MMPCTLRPTVSKRRRITGEDSPAATCTTEETSSAAVALQTVLREMQLLRREQQEKLEELAATLQRRGEEISELRENLQGTSESFASQLSRLRGSLQIQQLSPSNNVADRDDLPARGGDVFVARAANRADTIAYGGPASRFVPDAGASNRAASVADRAVFAAGASNLAACVTDRAAFAAGAENRVGTCAFGGTAERFEFAAGTPNVNSSARVAGRFDVAPRNVGECDSNCVSNVKLRPDTFDGSAPLREFFAQFNLIAFANRWGEVTKTAVLASCLRGKARAVLESVQNLESLDFAELRAKLELQFGEAHSLQNYYMQFTNRKQKFGESVASFGADIERLAQLAYPECSVSVRDKVACAQFVSALAEGYLKRALQMEGISSLRVAIERAKAIKLIQENSFGRKEGNNFNGRKEGNFEKEKNQGVDGRKGTNDEGKINKNGKFAKNKFDRKLTNKKECWECGKEGHFRSECPGRAGAENGA